MESIFRPLGYRKPDGIPKQPASEYKHAAGKRNDGFQSAAFIVGASMFFRCSYTMEKTGVTSDGRLQHFWRVRNAWFELTNFKTVSISEALQLAAPYIASPHNTDMMIAALRPLKRPYWPQRY